MAGDVDYKQRAIDAVEGMPPNSKREAHYYAFEGSPMQLVTEILRLPQVRVAALKSTQKSEFCVIIETNSTNC